MGSVNGVSYRNRPLSHRAAAALLMLLMLLMTGSEAETVVLEIQRQSENWTQSDRNHGVEFLFQNKLSKITDDIVQNLC